MPFYFDLKPKDGQPLLSLNEVLARVVVAFARSTFDREAAASTAADRLKHLTALGAPEEVLALYRSPHVVRCRVADTDPQAFLEFDAHDMQALQVYVQPESSSAGVELVRRLAEVLGYDYARQEYD